MEKELLAAYHVIFVSFVMAKSGFFFFLSDPPISFLKQINTYLDPLHQKKVTILDYDKKTVIDY